MPFSVEDFHDLIRLLEAHPEWQVELRRLLLSNELLTLPEVMRGLVEAQQRTEVRLEQLEGQVQRLAEAQLRTEARLEQLAGQMQQLAEAQLRTEARLDGVELRLDGVETRLHGVETRLDGVDVRLDRLTDDVGDLKGDAIERRYRDRAVAYFASLVRRPHVVVGDELAELLDQAIDQGMLTDVEADEVARADVIVRGRRRQDGTAVYLVAEVSWGVGTADVRRTIGRAALLAKLGSPALPVVAGDRVLPEAQTLAQEANVAMLTNGRASTSDIA